MVDIIVDIIALCHICLKSNVVIDLEKSTGVAICKECQEK
mgnify:CR=1 FL=1|jgi:hypothetical protein